MIIRVSSCGSHIAQQAVDEAAARETQVWRGSLLLAEYVLARAADFAGVTGCELGAGSGVAGIALACAGASCVFITDVGESVLGMCQVPSLRQGPACVLSALWTGKPQLVQSVASCRCDQTGACRPMLTPTDSSFRAAQQQPLSGGLIGVNPRQLPLAEHLLRLSKAVQWQADTCGSSASSTICNMPRHAATLGTLSTGTAARQRLLGRGQFTSCFCM